MTTHATQWVPDTSNFGVRLVLVRHEMGWNAKEAALACGISPQSWREWEMSGRRPRDYEGICKRIAARTQCNLIWLLAGDPTLMLTDAAAAFAVPAKPVTLRLTAERSAGLSYRGLSDDTTSTGAAA
jgi:transcriptional regulator with XRE-family HTH domain